MRVTVKIRLMKNMYFGCHWLMFWMPFCSISACVWDMHCFSGLDYINLDMEPLMRLDSPIASDDDDFFSSIKTTAQETSKELEGYLACSADHTSLLKTFPSVCKVSIKLNTPLPASAACERLFSIAGLLFSPRRARMDSSNFENQLLLKLNRSFYSLK